MIGVQSTNAPPLVEAFQNDDEKVATLPYANSTVSGINVPFTGDHALAAVRESGGRVVGVDDADIIAMQARIATEEGIWVEPAGAASSATLPVLLAGGHIAPSEKIVCVMSGAGFKDSLLAASHADDLRQQPPVPFDAEKISETAS
jgi:threonine synthase